MSGAANNAIIVDVSDYVTLWLFVDTLADAAAGASDILQATFSVDPSNAKVISTGTAAAGSYAPIATGIASSSGNSATNVITNSAILSGAGAQSVFSMWASPPPYLNLAFTRVAGIVPNRFTVSLFGRCG